MKPKCLISISVILTLALSACGSVPKDKFFRIVYDPPAAPATGLKTANYTLAVDRIKSIPLLRQTNIVYRDSTHQVDVYPFYRWETQPDTMVTDVLIHAFKAGRVFNRVTELAHADQTDFVLRGWLKRFEQVNSPAGTYAEIRLELELGRSSDRSVVWAETITRQ
ncbi:MAG: membrane integrity-associated transporter subunit PqiC, partial [Deltaproteobacteria bacterium]|nr:membrane integrity-associated transporter subunit PqiC [Deltaproteobacteria bacterium]